MHRTPALPMKEVVLAPSLATAMQNVVGQQVLTSRETYTIDAKHFAPWMADQNLSLFPLSRDDLALVQDAARHTDPKTTRRYQKRRNSLLHEGH